MLRDRRAVHYSVNCGGGDRSLFRGQDFTITDAGLESAFPLQLAPRLADLLDVAMSVYVVDRLERRPTGREMAGGSTWGRSLRVSIGVREPRFWAAEHSLLAELLFWLTDDRWDLDFQPRRGERFALETAHRLPLQFSDRPESVALFSGGLDSLAGSLIALEAGRRPLFVSVETNPRMASIQQLQLQALRSAFQGVISTSSEVNMVGQDHGEPSQRTRAMVFLALGGAVAIGSDAERVEVFENGIGAIGLPMSPTQEGAHTTKAMHPETLDLFSRLVSRASGSSVIFCNPSLWKTKAEMCSEVSPKHHRMLAKSESCDTAFSHRGTEYRCGTCTSCILRRQSLIGAGLEWIDRLQSTRIDVFRDEVASTDHQRELAVMLDQAERFMTALNSSDPWHALTGAFPQLLDAVSSEADRDGCLRLFASYVNEWRRVPSELVTRYLGDPRSERSGLK